jgi:dTDP-glucose 4,6-dehydratase
MDLNWQDKQVFVTGAGGFIASQLVEQLAGRGARVRAFTRYNSRGDDGMLRLLSDETMRRVEVVRGDLRDADAVRRAVDNSEYIFHLGALIAIPYSYVHPREVVETNVIGTLNVLEAARQARVTRMVHTSTSEVYGTARFVPITEEHPLQGQSPYSASKIGADKIAESYHKAFDVPVVTIRPFNTYGPRQSTRAVIPTIITQALTGDVIRLGSLTPTRDFTFVADTVDGFIRAASTDEGLGREINLGTDNEISIGELAQKIIAIVGGDKRIESASDRVRPDKSEVQRLHADFSLASRLLGWKPRVSLDEGLEKTVRWIEQHLHFYRSGVYQI